MVNLAMNRKIFGLLVIGIAALFGIMAYSFNKALTEIVAMSCTHGDTCPMWGTLAFQTNASLIIIGVIVMIGLVLIFYKKEKVVPQIEVKEINKENYKDILEGLVDEEKQIFEKIIEEKGSIFQSALVEKTGLNKVKVTRILDGLEGKGLIERKRRGMTNIVILKR